MGPGLLNPVTRWKSPKGWSSVSVHPDHEPLTDEVADGPAVVELEVREVGRRPDADTSADGEPSTARAMAELATELWIQSVRGTVALSRAVARRAGSGSSVRLMSEAAAGAADAFGEWVATDGRQASIFLEEQLGRVISVVVPAVVDAIDANEVIGEIDVGAVADTLDIDALVARVDTNALLDSIDMNRLLARVDVNAVLDRIEVDRLLDRVDIESLLRRADIDAVLDRVDVNALLGRMDLDALLARVDIEALLDDVDVNGFAARLDVEALLQRVDVASVAKRAHIGELVAESTSDVAGSALDVVRRQAVAIDTLLARGVNRLLGRSQDSMPTGPPLLAGEPGEEP